MDVNNIVDKVDKYFKKIFRYLKRILMIKKTFDIF